MRCEAVIFHRATVPQGEECELEFSQTVENLTGAHRRGKH